MERAGEAFPSPDIQENLRLLVRAADGDSPPYLECGHRALAAGAIAESIGIPVRHVTLYSDWPKASIVTHHLLEMKGEHGWEMHDPDYGFCFRMQSGHIASAEALMTTNVSVAEYVWRPRIRMARHIAFLVKAGFFSAVSTRDHDASDTLFISESKIAQATFVHEGRELAFDDYWQSALSYSTNKDVIFTGKPVAIKGAKVSVNTDWTRKARRAAARRG
ncbi:hypothetical protein ABIE45_002664 [Methylobacterium sp. OAE515]